MTEKEKRIAEMREEGLLFSEIGEKLGISPSSCQSIYARYKEKVKRAEKTGFPVDMPISIMRPLLREGIDSIDKLKDFIENGGDVRGIRMLGEKAEIYLKEMVKD